MNSKVIIIHGSSIIQRGLSDILGKNFKCSVRCFADFKAYQDKVDIYKEKCILFIEGKIANSEDYLKHILELDSVHSFSIIQNNEAQDVDNNPFTILIYDSPEKIYEQVKDAFKQPEIEKEESEGLSAREIDVLKLVALGFTNKEIAEKLFISTHTVMSHRKNMTEKLGIKSISGLTVYAIINNYIDTTNLKIKDLI